MADEDSPWKEALEQHFEPFLALLQQILERTPSVATIEEILALLPPTNGH